MARREHHHRRHLTFVKRVYLKQVGHGRHAHLEQPRHALSWSTQALKSLPGYTADFDQCRYGAMCLDVDGLWRPVQKSTRMLTTKKSVLAALHLKCEHDHQHCPLEGAAPGYGPRTTYLEDYQPAFAATLAAAIAQPEPAQLWDAAYVVDVPEKKATGHLETPQESGSSYARGTCRPPSRSWSSTVSCVCSQGLQVRGLLETQETQSGCSIDNATTAQLQRVHTG